MGLFSSLFGRGQKETGKKETRKEEKPEVQVQDAAWMKGLYRGMPLTVEGMESDSQPETELEDIFFLGKLMSFSTAGVSIEPASNREYLPVLPRGTAISFRGYRKDVSSVHLSAVVKDSEREVLRAGELELIEHPEGRSDFRLPLNIPGEVFAFEDTQLRRPKPCTILNISRGGACVLTGEQYGKESGLRLRLCLMEGTPVQSFAGTVIRATPRGEMCEYGILFEPLSEQRSLTLVNSMFSVQRKMRSEQVKRDEWANI